MALYKILSWSLILLLELFQHLFAMGVEGVGGHTFALSKILELLRTAWLAGK